MGDPGNEPQVLMIDMTHARTLEHMVTHRAPWRAPGNVEDGYLVGVDSLIRLLEKGGR